MTDPEITPNADRALPVTSGDLCRIHQVGEIRGAVGDAMLLAGIGAVLLHADASANNMPTISFAFENGSSSRGGMLVAAAGIVTCNAIFKGAVHHYRTRNRTRK